MENTNNWELKSLSIEKMTYGDYKGKYAGRVRFENDQNEAFLLNLTHEHTQKFLEIIATDLAVATGELTKKMMASIGLLTNGERPVDAIDASAEVVNNPEKISDLPF